MENKIRKKASCGHEDRADCLITIAPANSLNIEIKSKIKKIFGQAIEKSIKDVLHKRNIRNCHIIIYDFGALDWVIRARLECALERAGVA